MTASCTTATSDRNLPLDPATSGRILPSNLDDDDRQPAESPAPWIDLVARPTITAAVGYVQTSTASVDAGHLLLRTAKPRPGSGHEALRCRQQNPSTFGGHSLVHHRAPGHPGNTGDRVGGGSRYRVGPCCRTTPSGPTNSLFDEIRSRQRKVSFRRPYSVARRARFSASTSARKLTSRSRYPGEGRR